MANLSVRGAGADLSLLGAEGLASRTNKLNENGEQSLQQGIGDLTPELKLSMDDSEIIALTTEWTRKYKEYERELTFKQDEVEKYYLGQTRHKVLQSVNAFPNSKRPISDNLLFEALETFLPQATKQNPEPLVGTDESDEGQELASNVKNMLVYQSDRQQLRLILKKMTRHWSMAFLGVVKIGWDAEANDIKTEAIRTQSLILDSGCTIDDTGRYTGEYIGQLIEKSASDIVALFPEKLSLIKKRVDGKMATKITYTEWWTKDKLFFTLGREVLGKFRNPHWNYDGVEERLLETGETEEFEVRGSNHFDLPQMPFVFLSVFNMGKHPHDDTSLMYQNLSNQDIINKRVFQIDKNADNMNNGIVLSGDAFSKEQAKNANEALTAGDALWVPSGDIRGAYQRDQAPSLPGDIFNQLADMRGQLRGIFGITALTPGGIQQDRTVRGKILTKEVDASRIGGGITVYIEQAADQIFNWWIQMFYVYYTEPHAASVLGDKKSAQTFEIHNADLNRKLTVSVKEGALIPKDDMSQRSEAIELWGAGAIDPITLFEKLDFPDPIEKAKQLWQWQTDPASLFGEQPQQQMQQGLEFPAEQPIAGPDLLSNVPIQ